MRSVIRTARPSLVHVGLVAFAALTLVALAAEAPQARPKAAAPIARGEENASRSR